MEEYCNSRVEKNESEKAKLIDEYLYIAAGYKKHEWAGRQAQDIYDMVLIYLKKSFLLENKEDLTRFEECADKVNHYHSAAYYRELYHISKVIKGENHPDTIRILRKLTEHDPIPAKDFLKDLYKKYKTGLQLDSDDLMWLLSTLTSYKGVFFCSSNLELKAENMQEALDQYTDLCRLREEKYGKNHPDTQECKKNIAIIEAELKDVMRLLKKEKRKKAASPMSDTKNKTKPKKETKPKTESNPEINKTLPDLEFQTGELDQEELIAQGQLYGAVLQKEYTLKAFELFERAIAIIEETHLDMPEDNPWESVFTSSKADEVYGKMVEIADQYMEKGDLEDAWYFYKMICEKAPQCVLKEMAACSIKLGKETEAIKACQDYYKKEGDEAMDYLVDCYKVFDINIYDVKINCRR